MEIKEEARKLRKDGLTINQIYKILKVSKGSVSNWVRDIKLSKKHINNIDANTKKIRHNNILLCTKNNIDKYYNIRKQYQADGKKIAKKTHDIDFIAGCMLYWAEGSKERNSIIFCNTDIDMMVFFISFLRKYFIIDENKFSFYVQYYTNNGLCSNDIELFWQNSLKLKAINKRKCYINKTSSTNKGIKIGKRPYGTCRIRYNDSKIVQTIYGAIKYIANIDNDKWLY
jgi:predicted transcriptional regulator